jgi:hypothetical protein
MVAAVAACACSRTALGPGGTGGAADGGGGLGQGAGGAGGGGAGGGGSGGAGGEGGGGGPQSCSLVDPIARLSGGTQRHQVRPGLIFTSGALERATLLTAWTSGPDPEKPPLEIRHTSFEPWGAWPADGTFEPSFLADLDGGYSFAGAPEGSDRFAVMFTAPDGQSVWTRRNLDPGSGGLGVLHVHGTDQFAGARVLFAADARPTGPGGGGLKGVLGAFGRHDGVSHVGRPHIAWEDGSGWSTNLACASTPIDAAGVALARDAWIFAMTGGATTLDRGCASATADVFIGFFRAGDMGPPAASQHVASEVLALRAATHPSGAWLTWAYADGEGVRIDAARVDEAGTIALAPFQVTSGKAVVAASLAATALADRLAVVFITDLSPARIELRVFDEMGGLRASHSLATLDGLRPETAALGAPKGDRLLLAWSERVGTAYQAHIARLFCQP